LVPILAFDEAGHTDFFSIADARHLARIGDLRSNGAG